MSINSASIIAGVDEAGVGSLMGIMVAGAVILPNDFDCEILCDSKKISEKKRKFAYNKIISSAKYGIGVVTHQEIDDIGMAKCRRLVFHRALDSLNCNNIDKIIVDGTLFDSYKNIPHECIPKADATIKCVSAASIIAKHYRDTEILKLCDEYPELAQKYDWKKNKGYPSPNHLNALKTHKTSIFHRKSYAPCKINIS